METLRSSETSVDIERTTRRNISEDKTLNFNPRFLLAGSPVLFNCDYQHFVYN
jgi:hypothetical protein